MQKFNRGPGIASHGRDNLPGSLRERGVANILRGVENRLGCVF
jgi:hypothetical protein